MSHYDDQRVIALLHETVPEVPDVPHRLDMVRHKAGRQRARLWTQTLGAVTGVLVIVGVAAAVSVPSGGTVEPSSRPLDALTEAFTKESSVRFAMTSKPIGDVSAARDDALAMYVSDVTGAATKDGDFRLDGKIPLGMGMLGAADGESHLRMVDGVPYRSVAPFDFAPDGIEWVREEPAGDDRPDVDDLVRALRVAAAFAEDVHHVRGTVVRGVRVAEYALTATPPGAGRAIEMTFAIDGEDRLRRVAATVDLSALFGIGSEEMPAGSWSGPPPEVSVEVELYGYGDDVDIEVPPAARTMSEDELQAAGREKREAALRKYQECASKADTPDAQEDCAEEAGLPPWMSRTIHGQPLEVEPDVICAEPTPTSSSYSGCELSQVGVGWATAPPPASTASPAP
jgi:hypothetical protein